VLGGLAAAALVAGCGGAGDVPKATERHPVVRTPVAVTTGAPAPSATTGAATPVPAAARTASAAMPLEERVAQLFVVGFDGTALTADVFGELRGHGWGGVVIGSANAPTPDFASTLAAEATAIAQAAGRPVPLAATDPPVDATGVTLRLGQDADVPIVEGDPEAVAARARRAVRDGRAAGVAPAIGHFPGQGAASQDPLDGPAQVGLSLAGLRKRDLVPFRAIAREAPVIVVSSASYLAFDPVTPAALLPSVVGGLLRHEIGFGGVAMTDALASLEAATGRPPGELAVEALQAGIDLVYVPDPRARDAAYDAVLAAARSGALSAARVRDACARVLALKQTLG
jgi:beta-N-acetylhexosaminidase